MEARTRRARLVAADPRSSSRRRSAGQAGVGLIEVLAAMTVLAITASGIVAAIFLTLQVSETSRLTARVNSLSTSFGESLKALPYQVCGTASDYQTAFENADQRKVTDQQLTTVQGASLTVQSVADNSPGDASCPYGDSGTQVITINVTLRGNSHTAKVVKRTPSPNSPPPTIDFDAIARTPPNSPAVTFALIPKVTSTVGIYLYEWWCDGTWATTSPPGAAPTPTMVSEDSNDPRPACGPILAPVSPATATRTFALRVTDLSGVTWPALAKVFTVPPTLAGAPPPTAKITQVSSPACTTDDRCAANIPVVLDGRFSKAGDGRSIIKCVWNFADGSPPDVSMGPDCGSLDHPKSHAFIGKGTYGVTLTVTDDLGQSNTDSRSVIVDGPALVRPTVKIEGSVNGGAYSTAVKAIAPQRVQFRSNGTQGNGATIVNYEWSFGDGQTAQGASLTTADIKYVASTTGANCDGGIVGYRATLTVTDSNNIKNSASMCVSMAELPPPFGPTGFGFRYTNNNVGCCHWPPPILWLQLNFQWQRIPVPDGTPVGDLSIEVEISSSYNLTCWLGTKQATFSNAQPPPGQPTKGDNIKLWGLGGLFQGATVALGNDCVYKARTVRVYEGQTYMSAWSPTKNF